MIWKGKRVYPDEKGQLRLPPCSYGKDGDGLWHVRGPRGTTGVLDNHTITEHSDGTITVTPSLLFPGVWHGFLENGSFRDA